MHPVKNYENITILLVEDEPGDARLIREMLEETEYSSAHLHLARSLREAREAPVDHGSVATILLDLNLPDSSGIDTLRSIKEPYSDSAIIVLTGLDDEEMAIQALRAGAQSYLTKDEIEPSMLARTLRHSIERHGFIHRLRESDKLSMERDHRFRMLVEHSTDITLVVDQEGNIQYASPAAVRVFGYAENERVNAFAAIHPDDVVLTANSFEQVLHHPGMPLPMMVRVKASDGRSLWIEGTINNLQDVPGVSGIVANFHDITERIDHQHRIAFDRSNLNALINSTEDQVWSVDRDYRLITGNNVFLNGIERIVGKRLRPGDSLMLPDVDGASPSERWYGYFQRALSGETFLVEEHLREPRGAWIEVHYSPIREGDRIVGVTGFSRDITERRRMEERLRHNEATMAQAQAIAHFGSWELNLDRLDDPGGGPHSWSDEVYHIVGLQPGSKEVTLKTFFELVHLDDLTRVKAALSGTMRAGTPYSVDHRIVRPDGTVRWVHEEGALVLGPGELRRVLGTVHDISERKAVEQRVHRLNTELEERVVERTQELIRANQDLGSEMVKNQRLTDLLGLRNEDLMASITYARRIQNALFPAQLEISFFKGAACLTKPKDVVSGDFLWHYSTTEDVFLAVADCTGHGVPGALMSMLGNSLLNQFVLDRRIRSPEMVLIELDQALEDLFTQGHTDERIHDGMDIGLMKLDKSNMELLFAGALIPCLILRNGELMRLDCSRHPIGGHTPHLHKHFQQVRFQLLPGDRIILSTDGYRSQFGGPDGRKMKAEQFRALLERTHKLSAEDAVGLLDREFTAWMGDQEHIDDVLIAILDL